MSVGCTVLTVPVAHFLAVLTHILGDFAEVSAYGAIEVPTASVVDRDGKPTGEIIQKSAHDQMSLAGTLQSNHGQPGTFVNVVCRAAAPLVGEKGAGRTLLKWVIDGEDGSIEVVNEPQDVPWGGYFGLATKRVLLNGKEVLVDGSDLDKLGNTGKAWLEFAKGRDGIFWGIDESIKLQRVLDAALTSINEGKRISLR